MQKFCKYLLVSPAVCCALLFVNTAAFAGETSSTSEINQPQVLANPDIKAENIAPDRAMAQVTSVSQFSDVQPTDWAFQALQSLVERYGCIAGYPNSTYRGNRALTRYEFAAGLNACLDRVNELIATATGDLVKKEDLATLQKLQTDFSAELATLRGRVDAVEAKSAELETHQFSTTTKLNGEVVIAIASVVSGNTVNGQEVNQNAVLADRVRLNLDTSFTGKDLLRTRLQATNLDPFSQTATFTPEGDFRFAGGNNSNGVVIDALLYQFPLGSKTGITLEANAGAIDDFTNTVNPYLDGDGGSGALSHFGTRNPIYYLANGAGIGIKHEFSDKLELSLGYLANDAANPQLGSGLFNGAYGAMAQLTVKPSNQITLGLTYLNAYKNTFFANGSGGSNNANDILENASSNSYGIEASFQPSSKFVIGGWAGLTKARVLSVTPGDADIWNYAVTLAFPDLGKTGNIAGIIVGMEPRVTSVSSSLSNAGINKDPDTSYHIEGFYQYKLSDNISITPGVIWLTAPDHNNQNDDIVIGTVRTTFTF
ncbi:iron uptake porin [Nostoc sp. 'Peltigera membranacea cyanobiont' N6]|uniref:iron uptake porin n=1 Tax=Nostoc sp. 'Peltigera membranacea cyanobiont' N6 TaxID=1261031 RepID=UPI000CF34623|nr:iron uptake porin [Nostoc sp. 'Peltigera membranacea cyanobiont' N6]AVH65042.1 carbohydrate-selective porin OprB [Nostoc sp. 'Peltigera membranacea cyanobiont' N6]